MTLFETLPQFTMFVLFFMLGFVTRFFTQITMFICGITCGAVGKRLVLVWEKITCAIKIFFQKRIATRIADKKLKESQVVVSKIENTAKLSKRGNLENTAKLSKRGNLENTAKLSKRGNLENTAKLSKRGNLENTAKLSKRGNLENTAKLSKINIKKLTSSIAFWEVIYFGGLGVLTIATFSMFEYVDYFWFIPLAVILGVVANDYLTKEVFAKRKKI